MKLICDFNVSDTSSIKDLRYYRELGYTKIAVNLNFDLKDGNFESIFKSNSRNDFSKIRSKLEEKLRPSEVIASASRDPLLMKDVKIFSRLTIIASDSSTLKTFNTEFKSLFKQFDIVACEARSVEALSYAIEEMEIDLITFDLQEPLPLISKSAFGLFATRNIALEVNLRGALSSDTGRINTFALLARIREAPNSLVVTATSGATNRWLARNHIGLRSILDTLGCPKKRMHALNRAAEAVLQHGVARRFSASATAAMAHLSRLAGVKSVKVIPLKVVDQ